MEKRTKQTQLHKRKNRSKKNLRHRQKIVTIVLVLLLIMVLVSFAWYALWRMREVKSEDREVMAPYYLYLVDATGTDSLQLTVGNLHPGETKQIVIGVTNQKPDDSSETNYTIAKDSGFHYELELAHTSNLPIEYKLYALSEQTESTTNVSSDNIVEVSTSDLGSYVKKFTKTRLSANNTLSEQTTRNNNKEMYGESASDSSTVNWATYDIYDKYDQDSDFQLNTKIENGTVNYDLNYYLIELSWKNDIQFDNYLKETDLMYVIVNAMQPEPKEESSSTYSAGSAP